MADLPNVKKQHQRRRSMFQTCDRLVRYRSSQGFSAIKGGSSADPETQRLREVQEDSEWKFFGPYLPERQWGSVREDYSASGDAWGSFPHEHARARAFRWGDDGLFGLTDEEARLCVSFAMWNGKDHILKERLFGLTNPEGNHGEDVKELYYYVDSSPTHSYMHGLIKYPQQEYPYAELVRMNGERGCTDSEYEITDTSVFKGSDYWDVHVKYAKFAEHDILMEITAQNMNETDEAELHMMPQIWFRNTWSWGMRRGAYEKNSNDRPDKPQLSELSSDSDPIKVIDVQHDELPCEYKFVAAPAEVNGREVGDKPVCYFTENETNKPLLFGSQPKDGEGPYYKDAFHRKVVNGQEDAVNPKKTGTKACVYYKVRVPAKGTAVFRLRLRGIDAEDGDEESPEHMLVPKLFDAVVEQRKQETDEYYSSLFLFDIAPERMQILRQAYAGLLWSKKFYFYVVEDWLNGDTKGSKPPESRLTGRNSGWSHMYAADIISMCDAWEYVFFATWDLAFHTIPLSAIDPDFAKSQLRLFLDDRYMRPDGAMPAYDWNFSDLNPPVHPVAVMRTYKKTRLSDGKRDLNFLKVCFAKLTMNFLWWVNREDPDGVGLFAGGFLGLDNCSIFDRSAEVPGGGTMYQSDGSAWMGLYCVCMLDMAIELAVHDSSYEEICGFFLQHFIFICESMNSGANDAMGLWDEETGFYYDGLVTSSGEKIPIKLRSMVGLIPLYANLTIESDVLRRLPAFRKRLNWFLKNRPAFRENMTFMVPGETGHSKIVAGEDLEDLIESSDDKSGIAHPFLLSIASETHLRRILEHMLSENEFLAPFGIRTLSREYEKNPFRFTTQDGVERVVKYLPAESDSGMFGGNSSWRGSIWLPVSLMIVESLKRLYYFYGKRFKVDFPTGSGNQLTLGQVANEIVRRMEKMFLVDPETGLRPLHGNEAHMYKDKGWNDLILYYEYFNPETGRGVGASHQTGWTACISTLLLDLAEAESVPDGYEKVD
ncbi:Uncharacterized protein FVE85_5776 [Porphyridium purpureum]|uniref:Mannosylglycerate hydrolase MGH1-like glycoside hydrolase domain-containing protein n=1 Tax=Porphyridium purpureum TaxID=35688 RepID=A0A5J4Z2V0_PORPP|nr:Uncharacterized protein FVE85_5776 [Porphyridium purpureum]|eukprot:POR7956..scf295_1